MGHQWGSNVITDVNRISKSKRCYIQHCKSVMLLLLFSRLVMSDSFVTPWTVARQASLSMEFSRQEYWSGWPCPPSGDLPDPGTEPASPVLARRFFTTETPGKSRQVQRAVTPSLYSKAVVLQVSPDGSFSITWELVRNANFQAASKTDWIRNCYSKPLNNSDNWTPD